LANLCCALIENGRIRTTLAKAKALRPFTEKIITLAKKAHLADDNDKATKVHYRRLAIARIRNKNAVKKLFDELAEQFVSRSGGYTRIYKLAMPRRGDAAELAIIEFVEASDEGYGKKKGKRKKTAKKIKPVEEAAEEQTGEEPIASAEEADEAKEDKPTEAVAEEATDEGTEVSEEETSEPEEEVTEATSEDNEKVEEAGSEDVSQEKVSTEESMEATEPVEEEPAPNVDEPEADAAGEKKKD
jgi:large subunit ribosomal protein L17